MNLLGKYKEFEYIFKKLKKYDFLQKVRRKYGSHIEY